LQVYTFIVQEKEQTSLCSDNVAGGRNGIAEIKLKELKHEKGHIALGE
jgi:hypothetical protein